MNHEWIDDDDGINDGEYKIRYKSKNITEASVQIVAWLSGKQGQNYTESHVYTYLMNKFDNNENVAKSYAFRMLIHLIGDIV